MSLVLYDGDVPNNPNNPNVSVVLNDPLRNAIVLHNKETNELSVLKTVSQIPHQGSNGAHFHGVDSFQQFQQFQPLDFVGGGSRRSDYDVQECPNCGFILNQENDYFSANEKQREQERDRYVPAMDGFIHSNYFRLLGNGTMLDDGHLSDSLFTQGYFDKFFKEISLLGRGARGSVYKVEHILNGISLGVFAMKKITIGDDSKWLLKVLKEVTMLCKISFNNANLVNYNHVWLEVSSINDFGPKVPCAYILQQYCSGGNLEDFVNNLQKPQLKNKDLKKWKLQNKNGKLLGRLLTNDEILIIFSQIVKGVDELHKNHIIHRDLKPSNCLLSKPYITDFTNLEEELVKIPNILVSDFGESQIEGEERNATGATGTLEYTAPELLNTKSFKVSQFNKKTDVYSLGMILYFLCFSKLPFKSQDYDVISKEIPHLELDLDIRPDLDINFQKLIKNLTSVNSEERFNTDEILQILLNIGSNNGIHNGIHNENNMKENDDVVMRTSPQVTRRLSLTDGKDFKLIDLIHKYKHKHTGKIISSLLNIGIVSAIPYTYISSILLLLIGVSINMDMRYSLYLNIISLSTLFIWYIIH